jgi:hypothetical protein
MDAAAAGQADTVRILLDYDADRKLLNKVKTYVISTVRMCVH